MAGMIRSIFGLTTEDVREQQLKQQQALAQQFAKQTGANMGVASIGTAIGAGLGRGLMSRLGFEDPEMVKAQEVEARQTGLNEQLAALDPNDPRRQYLLAEALSSMGDTQGSLAAYASGRQMEQYQSQLAHQDRTFNLSQSEADRQEEQRNRMYSLRIEQAAADKKAQAAKLFADISATGLYGPEQIANIVNSAYPDSGFNIPTETTDTPDPSKLGDNKTNTNSLMQRLGDLPIGTIVPLEGQTYIITEDGAVLQEKPTKGRGNRSSSRKTRQN